MSYVGKQRGKYKILQTVRIKYLGGGNAQIIKDSGAPQNVTVNTSSWLEIFNSIAATVNYFSIFDSTGNTARLGVGTIGNEQDVLLIVPGGNGDVSARIEQGSRICIRPILDPEADTETVMTFFD